MDFKEFEQLYRDDPAVFHLGLDLFERNGRIAITDSTDQELRTDTVGMLSGLYENHRIEKIMRAARDFARLSTIDLLACAARCVIKLESDPVDKPGVCPLCGGSLIYGEEASAHRPHAIGWTCESCGATGKEAYREVFDCHYDLRDSEGPIRWNAGFKMNKGENYENDVHPQGPDRGL